MRIDWTVLKKEYKKHIVAGGVLAFEVGINQADDVAKIMQENGFVNVSKRKDYAEIDRVVFGTAN